MGLLFAFLSPHLPAIVKGPSKSHLLEVREVCLRIAPLVLWPLRKVAWVIALAWTAGTIKARV